MRPILKFFVVTLLLVGPAGLHAERFECLVEPYVEVQLASGVPGILDTVHVDRGDSVKSGQVLAELKSGVQQANLDLMRQIH